MKAARRYLGISGARDRSGGRRLAAWFSAVGWLAWSGAGCVVPSAAGSVERTAQRTIEALAGRDFADLARLAHPDRGVRFSPYAYVQTDRDVVLSGREIRSSAEGREILWGELDGTGDPILLTFAEYVERFVYDVDFAHADEVGWDVRLGLGNSIDNSREVYAGARVVEYHVAGVDPELESIDWRSLRLVFANEAESWYLVGVIHDQWTT